MDGDVTDVTAKKAAFLAALEESVNISEACRVVGIARLTAYRWRDADESFAVKWQECLSRGGDLLEDEAIRRAREGWDEPVWHQGVQVGKVRKYSDTLLIFLLKGQKRDVYGDKSEVKHSGALAVSSMTDDELNKRLAQLIQSQPQG